MNEVPTSTNNMLQSLVMRCLELINARGQVMLSIYLLPTHTCFVGEAERVCCVGCATIYTVDALNTHVTKEDLGIIASFGFDGVSMPIYIYIYIPPTLSSFLIKCKI